MNHSDLPASMLCRCGRKGRSRVRGRGRGKEALQMRAEGGCAPSVSWRKRGGTGRLTSQLLLLRARRPVTSSNKVRHAASAAPLPAPARAQTRFRQFPPGHALLLPLAHTACEHRISFSVRFSCTHAPSVGSGLVDNRLLHRRLLIFLGAKGAEDFWQVIES